MHLILRQVSSVPGRFLRQVQALRPSLIVLLNRQFDRSADPVQLIDLETRPAGTARASECVSYLACSRGDRFV